MEKSAVPLWFPTPPLSKLTTRYFQNFCMTPAKTNYRCNEQIFLCRFLNHFDICSGWLLHAINTQFWHLRENQATALGLSPQTDSTKLTALTLSQLYFSGNPVAIQCAWNLDRSVHWNATAERIVGSQCLPVCFKWSSSGLPVVFQYVLIVQINTGSPLGHHWVLVSASVVPVASQGTCGSSGVPVYFCYAN